MAPLESRREIVGVANFGFARMLAWLAIGVLSAGMAPAQAAPTITNLAQLAALQIPGQEMTGDLALEGTVFGCDTEAGVMILESHGAAELLEVEGLKQEFKPGDRIRLECRSASCIASDYGIHLDAVPLLNNDGGHGSMTVAAEKFFPAGRYPLRLEWFNQYGELDLNASAAAPGPDPASGKTPGPPTNLLHAVSAVCFEGLWYQLPNFQLLHPVRTGVVTNFDPGFRTRDEMVGICFDGYFEAPRPGKYAFSLRSDDGSRLWIGEAGVAVTKLSGGAPPAAPPAALNEPVRDWTERRLAALEGRVDFVSRHGKGLEFEICSGQNSASVGVADAGSLEPADLLNAYVRVSGVAQGVLADNRQPGLGRLAAASFRELAILQSPPNKGGQPARLTTVMQVHSLSREDAARQLAVAIRGVVTAVGRPVDRWMAIQDDTRGAFVSLTYASNCFPQVGEVWSISGHTQPGDFAPIVIADQAKLLGIGRLPAPVHVTWNQLVNGSMDVQWVELAGLVTAVAGNHLSLLMPEGREEIVMREWGDAELKPFDKAVVRIRGAVFAAWKPESHEVRVGSITMHNASLSVDKPAPEDLFNAPEKTPRSLFNFDARASPFQRVKVRGQVTYLDAQRLFVQRGSGIEILPAANVSFHVGDLVEAVGLPEISGAMPRLREASVRKTGAGALPAAPFIPDSQLPEEQLSGARIRIEGELAGQHAEEDTLVLQIQTHANLFHARIPRAGPMRFWRLGSTLAMTGVYVSDVDNGLPAGGRAPFEVLLNSPADVAVTAEPSWWTLQRLLSAVGVLLVTLALAAVWIALLRREVAQRTLQLQHEIRERERAERQHELEAERARIARDLHDDLGSSLTEINALASTGRSPRAEDNAHPALFNAIAEKARALVASLDVIVWAVNPEGNSLQSLADYLGGYTREYLSNSAIVCRFKIPVVLPNVTLDGQVRHEVFMAVKETLNNVVRHAGASEVEFRLRISGQTLEIDIADNGKGFDPSAEAAGHGLKNRSARLAKIGGSCRVESHAGGGTTVRLRLPLPPGPLDAGGNSDTTFG